MTQSKTAPRWVQLLRTAVDDSMKENKDSISYALSSLDNHKGQFVAPRVRFVVHRGFVNERRAKEDATWSSNDSKDENGDELISNSIMVTTDVRAPKSLQISSNPEGGITELAWWLLPVAHQYRIRARAFICPHPSNPLHAQFPASRLSPYSPAQEAKTPFNWEDERVRIFRKMSPSLRASFCRPTPGGELGGIDMGSFPAELPTDLEAKTEQEKKDIQIALKHLALIVMEPFEVDWCDLKSSPNQRKVWNKGPEGEWTETAIVP